MSSHISTQAVVLKRNKVSPTDSYIKLFTRALGIIDVYTKGSNSPKSHLNKASQPFVFGNFTIYVSKSFQLKEAEVVHSFYDVRLDHQKYKYFSYLSLAVLKFLDLKISNQYIFEQLINSMYLINSHKEYADKIVYYFLYAYCSDYGILPKFTDQDLGKYINIDGTISSKATSTSDYISNFQVDIKKGIKAALKNIDEKNNLHFIEKYIKYHMNIDLASIKENIESLISL